MGKNLSNYFLSGDIQAVYQADCHHRPLANAPSARCKLCGRDFRNLEAHMALSHDSFGVIDKNEKDEKV